MPAFAARLVLAALVCVGCSSNAPAQLGAGEPFRVEPPAQFVRGSLPGTPPASATAAPSGDAAVDAGNDARPAIVDFATAGRTPAQGQGRFRIRGSLSASAYSVGIALDGVGDGYWVLPAGAPEPDTGNLAWSADCDFDERIPTGLYNLRAVALDANGAAGGQSQKQICVASRVPDNFNSCVGAAPPSAVVSLTWNTNVDLDLQVQLPDGSFVSSKTPHTAADSGLPPAELDRDSNAACVVDGIRAENLVWTGAKPVGRYGVYVNLFDACKQPSVTFTVAVYWEVDDDDGGKRLEQKYVKSGILLDSQANGGSARGLFVTELDFN